MAAGYFEVWGWRWVEGLPWGRVCTACLFLSRRVACLLGVSQRGWVNAQGSDSWSLLYVPPSPPRVTSSVAIYFILHSHTHMDHSFLSPELQSPTALIVLEAPQTFVQSRALGSGALPPPPLCSRSRLVASPLSPQTSRLELLPLFLISLLPFKVLQVHSADTEVSPFCPVRVS